jgi:hypothetical protein
MKAIFKHLLALAILLISVSTYGEGDVCVTGIVIDETSQPVKGATVFISGSERITATNEGGRFTFIKVPQGTYQLSVQMMGYCPLTRNMIVKETNVDVSLPLKVRTITLNEVMIGRSDAWDKNFQIFKDNFLGRSDNAKDCAILNPNAITFSTKKGLLMAEADEFLVVENKRLGYRIRYQLKDFGYNLVDDIALYHGESSFEELPCTDSLKKAWAKNRLDAYKGSFMHFLRSVYQNETLENGFITQNLHGYITFRVAAHPEDRDRIVVDDKPIVFDSLVNVIDTSFISLKFKQLYVVYNPQKANTYRATHFGLKKNIEIDSQASIIKLALPEAVIDRKGSYTDYRDFFIQGNWARARVGDQLPVEYQPPPVADN